METFFWSKLFKILGHIKSALKKTFISTSKVKVTILKTEPITTRTG